MTQPVPNATMWYSNAPPSLTLKHTLSSLNDLISSLIHILLPYCLTLSCPLIPVSWLTAISALSSCLAPAGHQLCTFIQSQTFHPSCRFYSSTCWRTSERSRGHVFHTPACFTPSSLSLHSLFVYRRYHRGLLRRIGWVKSMSCVAQWHGRCLVSFRYYMLENRPRNLYGMVCHSCQNAPRNTKECKSHFDALPYLFSSSLQSSLLWILFLFPFNSKHAPPHPPPPVSFRTFILVNYSLYKTHAWFALD